MAYFEEGYNVMESNGKVVILTDAGASQALDIPAMSGMFEAFMQKRKSGLSAGDVRELRYKS